MSSRVVSPVFIGRRGELTSLGALMDQAQAREPAFAVIGGEAGVGKTRLVGEAAERAAGAGFLVLTGQCVELGAEGLPLAPLVDALRILARALPPGELAEVLGPAGPALVRLLPELLPDTESRRPGEEIQKAQLLELVLGVLDRLSATRPVLFVIEDLHWADQSTLDLAAFLIRSLRGGRVLLIATYRSDELHRRHPLRPLLAAWERVRSVERLEMPRFDRGEVSAQLAAILGDDPAPAVTDLVFDRSGGNAYLVEELAGTVSEDGAGDLPPSLRDVLLSRVDALSEDAQRLLRVVSVAGRTVSDELLAAVAGTAEAELYAALREAIGNHLLLIGPGGRGYAFRHALTRDAVYEDVLPGERVRLHAAYAEALTRDPRLADDEAALPAALAYHWYAALDLPQALPAAIEAARHATASYAPAEALRHLERALEIWPRVSDAEQRTGLDLTEVSRLAAEAAYRSGTLNRSGSLLADALARLPATASPVRRALLLERQAVIQRDSGRQPAAVASLEEALALLPAGDADGGRAHAVLLAALAGVLMRGSEMERSADVARRAVAAARKAGAREAEAEAAITLGSGIAYLDEPEAGLESLRAGVRLALELDIPITAIRGYVNLSDVAELLGRHEEAVREASAGLDLAVRAGIARTFGTYLIGNQAEPLLRMGEWERADELMARSMDTMPEGVFAASVQQLRAELLAMRGRYDDAERDLRELRRAMGDTDDAQFTQPSRYLEAMIALSRGDLGAARAAAAAGLEGGTADWKARYAWPVLWQAMR
ncbi:MAG: ATP-binding protein, partial [Streptosporangiaceae bacterium]